jgi:hypothetical protein
MRDGRDYKFFAIDMRWFRHKNKMLNYSLRTHECITSFVPLCGRHFEWRELSEQTIHPSVTIVLLINRLYLVTRKERSQPVGQSDVL